MVIKYAVGQLLRYVKFLHLKSFLTWKREWKFLSLKAFKQRYQTVHKPYFACKIVCVS